MVATESLSRVRPGWTLGGGVEYAFAPAWSARLEYRYSDFGRYSDSPSIYALSYTERHREATHGARFGVSYRF